ncbi:hypothetical protein DAPPUDRAFT_251904 [Daphnia pulex]|uniref:Uncharacterized protein n=1 Tax=Daphnia pulex TaxID=6669 RepID=E9H1N1_DAPPU|nr:hypothetical protein DAPPUDRAFT_251904 [Daphnia pulex]|eukprot:EFX74380.1 hypothetical protein DAPPUDRAFT_251904 [Daphnia pulex]
MVGDDVSCLFEYQVSNPPLINELQHAEQMMMMLGKKSTRGVYCYTALYLQHHQPGDGDCASLETSAAARQGKTRTAGDLFPASAVEWKKVSNH